MKAVQEFVKELKKEFRKDLVSVVLFGSSLGKLSEKSDVDFVIIFSDKTNLENARNKVLVIKKDIENKYKVKFDKREKIPILSFIEGSTGMFVSPFITKESHFKYMKFEKIFSTNNIMTKLLAPTNAVFLSIKNNKKILYGKDHTKHWNIKMNFSTKIKAALTSLFLAIFGIIIFPSPPSMKYSCEALKWAMLSASGKGTEKAIRHFERKMDLRTFLAYRNGKYIGAKERISFVFKAPVYVIKCFW